jgi:hypothetical protein
MPILSRPHGPASRAVLAIALLLTPQISFAQSCKVDLAAVEKSIARLELSYADVLSDISCDAPTVKAHQLMCDSADEYPSGLWRMGRLDDLAWVYANENATGREVDRAAPPRDAAFIAKRDACSDAACLCDVIVSHTNDSLGGESPYSEP